MKNEQAKGIFYNAPEGQYFIQIEVIHGSITPERVGMAILKHRMENDGEAVFSRKSIKNWLQEYTDEMNQLRRDDGIEEAPEVWQNVDCICDKIFHCNVEFAIIGQDDHEVSREYRNECEFELLKLFQDLANEIEEETRSPEDQALRAKFSGGLPQLGGC